MSDKLFDALETCLQAIENGETVDSTLTRFPTLAADLRPILETSLQARALGGLPVPAEAQRRGRVRVLRRAAELREAQRAPRRSWLFSFRPAALTFILAIFLLSGTGLVRAASSSLPGDNLYPLKRTWEDVRLAFVSDEQEIESIELAYETERIEETNELIARGRTETVSFSGYLTTQPDGTWTVAGIPIIINADTILPANPLRAGAAIRVTGTTDANGFLVAQSVDEAPAGSIVPDVEDDGHEEGPGDETPDEGGSGQGAGSGGDSSAAEVSKYRGILETIDGNKWVVNGVDVDVSGAVIEGVPFAGAEVIVEGYYTADGVFIATRVIFVGSGGANENGNENGNGGSNSNDDEEDVPELEQECSNSGSGSPCDDNENKNENENENENDPPEP